MRLLGGDPTTGGDAHTLPTPPNAKAAPMATSVGARAAAQQLDDLAHALSTQLASAANQVQRLQQCSSVLAAHHQQCRRLDAATQTDEGPSTNPLRYVKAPPDTTQPFAFRAPARPVNWRRLRAVDPRQLLSCNDTAAAMQLLDEVALGCVQQGSIYERSEANLEKLLALAQLQVQFLSYKLQEKLQAEQVLEDDVLALAAGLSSLMPPSLTDVSSGLGSLGSGLRQLGGSRVAGLISQVRAEERAAAQAALDAAIEQTKAHVQSKYGSGECGPV